MCSPRDIEWIPIEPISNPHLVSGEWTQTEDNGEQSVPMTRWTQNLDHVAGMLNQCSHHGCGQVWYQRQRSMRHVHDTWWMSCGTQKLEMLVDGVRDRYELDCWIKKPGNVLAPVQVGGSSGSASEFAGHRATVPQRADAEMSMDAQPQGAHAPRADEEHNAVEIFPVTSLNKPENPARTRSRNTICCMFLRCRGATSASGPRAETISTEKRDRKAFQWFHSHSHSLSFPNTKMLLSR